MSDDAKLLPILILMIAAQATGSYSDQVETPVLIVSGEECQVSVDGKSLGAVVPGAVRKIALTPGEHLVSAVCPGQRLWNNTVTVGKDQKIVAIPTANAVKDQANSTKDVATPEPANAAAPEPLGSGCFLIHEDESDTSKLMSKVRPAAASGWKVGAVLRKSPCDNAGIRPGSFVISIGGTKATDLTRENRWKLENGPLGAKVTWELMEREGDIWGSRGLSVSTVVITPAALPAIGTMEVLQPDGKTKMLPFDRSIFLAQSGIQPQAAISPSSQA